MDERNTKFDLVLRVIEHPEEFSSDRLDEILSDPEAREIYNLLCKIDSTVKTENEIDVESEWESFISRHPLKHRRNFLGINNRAASVLLFITGPLAAVAIGVAVSLGISNSKKSEPIPLQEVSQTKSAEALSSGLNHEKQDTIVSIPSEPVMFENSSLSEIMETVAKRYDVEIKFNNAQAPQLRLYYKFDPSLSLDEIISQLNTFEQIHISRNNNLLLID